MIAKLLSKELENRESRNELRKLRILPSHHVDFCSNDYLGLIRSGDLERSIQEAITTACPTSSRLAGAGSSRLIAGNNQHVQAFEEWLSTFYGGEAALIFTSGYNANLGLISALGTLNDLVFLYDEQIHASMRDGFRLSRAKSHHFQHNDLDHLENLLQLQKKEVIVFAEAVYSMEGDRAPLVDMVELIERYGAKLIVDEAHAVGLYGASGEGLVQSLGLSDRVFARVCGWGKAHGSQGAVIIAEQQTKEFLINFSRPFIYSTGISHLMLIAAECSYRIVQRARTERAKMKRLIDEWNTHPSNDLITISNNATPIQILQPTQPRAEATALIHKLSSILLAHKMNVVPIYSPTVSRGSERIRISLHAFNSPEEVRTLLQLVDNIAMSTDIIAEGSA